MNDATPIAAHGCPRGLPTKVRCPFLPRAEECFPYVLFANGGSPAPDATPTAAPTAYVAPTPVPSTRVTITRAAHAADDEEAMPHYRRVRDEIRAFVETLPDVLNQTAERHGASAQ